MGPALPRTARAMIGRGARFIAMLAVGFAGMPSSGLSAQAGDNGLEYKVEATYLSKFGAFVDWPSSVFESPDSPINLCVVGQDPFDGILDQVVMGQRIDMRPIALHRLKAVTADSGCQILYVGGSDQKAAVLAMDAVRSAAVLTVTDADNDSVAGIIHFVIKDNRVRFEIDDRSASLKGLKISSKLLNLALSVRAGP